MKVAQPHSMVQVLKAVLIGLLVLAPGLNARCWAQIAGEGAIQGRISDPSGAVIPNASITALEGSTGMKTVRSSTSAGVYTISPLPVGLYTVTVKVPGFETSVQEKVQVDGNQAVGLDFNLTVGQQSESVTVSSAPPALQTTNAMVGEVIDNETYEQLPLIMTNGPLDPTAFLGLLNGVVANSQPGLYNGTSGVLSGLGGTGGPHG